MRDYALGFAERSRWNDLHAKVSSIGFDLRLLPNEGVEVVNQSHGCLTSLFHVQVAVELASDSDRFLNLLYQMGSSANDRRKRLIEWSERKIDVWAAKKTICGKIINLEGVIREIGDGCWGYGGDSIAVYLDNSGEPFPSSQVIAN